MSNTSPIIAPGDQILVTGAAGFIGVRVVAALLQQGYRKVRCLVRPSSNTARLQAVLKDYGAGDQVEIFRGNLLSAEDCSAAVKGAVVIYHLAAGTGMKSFSEAFLNSVVTTRNLLEAVLRQGGLRRFVNLSSFAVYSNRRQGPRRLLDENSPLEERAGSRAEAYCYAKVKQDELVSQYGKERGLPYVLLRPGVVFGPGKRSITGRIGVDTFGLFLHLGGTNRIPFTYVDNCAEAIVLAGLQPGIDGEVFNIVDDDLPSSRQFLRQYKRNVRSFKSLYVPHGLSYLFCLVWEKYSKWSQGQLPAAFTRDEWSAYWKPTRYSNAKLKQRLGWTPQVTMEEGLRRFFEGCRERPTHA